MGLNRAPEQLIKAGLAALKQKDYERAIATFQQLAQAANVSAGHRVKAQMGLIRTYEAQGNNTLAQNLCKPLLKSRSQAIRQWSHDKLQQLAANSSEITGSGSQPPHSSEFVSASGFIPFTGNAPSTPIDPSTEQTAPLLGIEPSANTVDTNDSVPSSNLEDSNSCEDVALDVETTRSSLFHYETLNNKRGLSAKESEHAEDTAVTNDDSYLTPSNPSDTEPSDDSFPKRSVSNSSNTLLQTGASKQQNSPLRKIADKFSEDSPYSWPKGDRLSKLKSLGKVKIGRLWFAQVVTIPILFLVVRWLFVMTLTATRDYLLFMTRLLPFNIPLSTFFWQPQTWTVIAGLGLLTIASPWLWSFLLKPTEQVTSQTLQDYSPETVQLLRRVSTKRRFKFPKIYLLASDLPLIFSYGWNPRYGQLVLSQGLLDGLDADELAAIIMYEISHWSTLDWIFFSTHGLLLQVCHRTYWFLANKGRDRSIIIKTAAGILATLSYLIFWVLSKVGCGLARTRTPYRDRSATELTGNPNGLVRALSKISIAMTNAVNQQGYTPPLLESLDLMLPVGPGGCVEPTLHHYAWDMLNPLRHWLSINQAHPPLGERLYTLSAYGRHWRLQPSLNVTRLQPKRNSAALSIDDWKTLLLQGGLWSGFILGLGIAVILWMVGAVAIAFDFPLLSWLYRDRSILLGIPLICAATNQLLLINPFFPEIGEKRTTSEAQLVSWKTDSTLTPLSYRPVTLSGTLTGRPALANWLGQEWRLNTVKGSIKLHYASYLGPLSNIKSLAPWLNQPLEVTGWFRRGYSFWVDVDRIQINKNLIKQAQLPVWSMIVSLIPLCCGLWLIFRGA